MKYASDFRRLARDSLRGKWTIAVIAGIIASLLGAISYNGPKINFNFNDGGASLNLTYANQQIYSTQTGFLPELNGWLIGGAVYIILAVIALAAVVLILGSIISLGYSRFNLDLVDQQKEPELNTLFGYFGNWKTATLANLLQMVYILLWSLLLFIPGVIAAFSYAMTRCILAENPELAPRESIKPSKQMMAGNRWRLFCLQLSFIGWDILAGFTLGIGNLWLIPYKQAATAAFYREISDTACRNPNGGKAH